MATVNLGRIKPVWQGAWDNSTQYIADDIVQYNNHAWVATTTNTNSAPSDANANWDLMARGSVIPDQTSHAGKALVTDGTNLSWGNGGALLQVKSYRKTSGWSSGNNGTGRVEVAPFDGSAVITPSSSTSLIAAYVHIVVKHGATWRSGFIKVQGNSGSGWFDFGTATSSTYNTTNVSGNDYAGMFFIPNQGNTNPHYVRIFNEPHDNGYNHRLGSTIDTDTDDNANRSVFGTAAVLTLFEYSGDVASLTTIS